LTDSIIGFTETNLSTYLNNQTNCTDENEEIVDDDESGDFKYFQRDSQLVKDIERRYTSKRIKKSLINENKENESFFSLNYYYLVYIENSSY
jgi:hypothetical protein